MDIIINIFAGLGFLTTLGVIYAAIKDRKNKVMNDAHVDFHRRRAIAYKTLNQIEKKYTEILSQYPDIRAVTLGQSEEAYKLAMSSVEMDESIMTDFHYMVSNSLEYNIRLMDKYKNKEANNDLLYHN